MSADFTPEKEDYKILPPFKMQVLTNFPYIEADFDALTNYELLCKIVEYLNNVISNENEVTEQITGLYNAYVSLQNYINNYFDNLDVQEEINNKLDKMAEDGTLTTLIGNYVQPLINEQNTVINNFKNSVNDEITNINSRVNSIASGSPLVASSTAGMTDTTRVYVNTTDGKWYYYDGDSWEIGGTYQTTGIGEDTITYKMLDSQYVQKLKYQNSPIYYGYSKFEHPYMTLENGALDNSTGATTSSNNCIRTTNAFVYDYDNPIRIINNATNLYRFKIYDYGTDNSYVSNAGWFTSANYQIPASYDNHYIKLVFNATTQQTSYNLTQQELFTYVKIVNDTNKLNNFEQLTKMNEVAGSGEEITYTKTPQSFGYNKFIQELHNPLLIEGGSYTYTNGNKNNANDGVRSEKYKLSGNITIVNNDTDHYRVRVFSWLSDGTFDTYIGWSSAKELNVTIDTTKYYAITICTQVSGQDINKDDVLNKIGVFYSSDRLNKTTKTIVTKSYINSGAHQGGSFNSIPMNTLEAFNQTYQYGFDSVEFDVWWTSDRVPVVSHDGTRTTIDSQTVTIPNVTYDELMTYQFYSDSSIKIPKLFDVLKMCQIHHYQINIEFKTYDFTNQELKDIIDYIKALGFKKEDVLYNSVHQSILGRCRALDPGCNVTLGVHPAPSKSDLMNSSDYATLRTLLSQDGHTWISVNEGDLSGTDLLKDYKDLGYYVLLFYTGSSTSRILTYMKYIDAILTNYFTIADVIMNNDIMDVFE